MFPMKTNVKYKYDSRYPLDLQSKVKHLRVIASSTYDFPTDLCELRESCACHFCLQCQLNFPVSQVTLQSLIVVEALIRVEAGFSPKLNKRGGSN